MKIVGKKLNRKEFTEYISQKNFGSIPPDKLVIHHTWKPKKHEWNGKHSIQGLKMYYEGKQWSACPHIFVAEDGIWLFTDMYDVGIHAGSLNATWTRWGKEYKGYTKPIGAKLKSYSIGLEVVGDYDNNTWTGETKLNALHAISELQKLLNIENREIYFHRDVSKKSCPGHAITKQWLFNEILKYRAGIHKLDWEDEVKVATQWFDKNDIIKNTKPDKKLANLTVGWLMAVLKRLHDNK